MPPSVRLTIGALLAVTAVLLATNVAHPAGPAPEQPSAVKAAFEKMKSLAGDWECKRPHLLNTFRVIGEGSALLHLEKPDGRPEIVTVFYPVGAELWADHYCFMKNQPRYVAKPSSDPNVIDFEFRDITNLAAAPGEAHMHSTTWRLIDAGHLIQDWHVYKDGKEIRVNHLEFTRKID